MTEHTRHQEGAFSWADLSTTDVDAAKSFYTAVFGWEIEDQPIPEDAGGGVYCMARVRGKDVCAIQELRKDQLDSGMPPIWTTYFSVEDVDLKAKEVEAAGGSLMMPPFDVMEAGRMTVAADPTGAMFCLWQAKDMIGAYVTNEPNTLGWAECYTPDVEKARDFYTHVLGWTFTETDMGEAGIYTVFAIGDKSVAGLMEPPMEGMPALWNIYFDVEDCDATVEKVKANGGNVLMDPATVPQAGRFAFVTDGQGAAFGVLDPKLA
jgi:uncharacterized protein